MNAHLTVIFAGKHSEDKIIYETIDTFIRKRNLSNVMNVEKDFVNRVLWRYIVFYIWKSHLIVVRFAIDALIKGQTSKHFC